MPHWDEPERKRPLLFSVSHDGYSEPNSLRETYKLCEDFVRFFFDIKELTTLTPGICVSSRGRHYVFVETALHRLKHFSRHTGIQITSHTIIEECARLVSIFHLAVLWRDSVNHPNSNTDFIEEVDTILKRSEELCQKSIENVMYCIIAHPRRGLYSTKRSGFVVRLMSIARLLSIPAWQKVKETMLHMLAGITIQELDGLCWNADLLFTEINDSDRSIALPSIDD
jgi:sulfur relay (sulfurtransferase) complex TusBCD TusD component (DsrE family)